MLARDKEFYDVVGQGLAGLGFTGDNAFHLWVEDTFAEKYNAEKTFEQMGFPLNPDVKINPTYEQIEVNIRPYTMAAYVDIDSDGPTKSTDGLALKLGGLPTFKHETVLNRKMLREKALIAEQLGCYTPEMEALVMDLLFTNTDTLLGGNYNTFRYQRNQIVSNEGKLVINKTNNPLGIAVELDFGVPAKNIQTSKWYTRGAGNAVTQDAAVGKGVLPIKVMKDVKYQATNVDYAGPGHWECSQTTWDTLKELPYFLTGYVVAKRPDITDKDVQLAYGSTIPEEDIKRYIESAVGAPIRVIDDLAFVEKFNDKTRKVESIALPSFNDDVLVYVPDGAIGDAQFGKPVVMQTPGARVSLFDGGRTLLRQVFNDENMTQVIKSEVTGLCVPNRTKHMYYLKIA